MRTTFLFIVNWRTVKNVNFPKGEVLQLISMMVGFQPTACYIDKMYKGVFAC